MPNTKQAHPPGCLFLVFRGEVEVFQSEADMRGLQQLVDQYIALYNNQSTKTKKIAQPID